ncbi:MAG: tRNA (adenosine(37)-N6)-threonylcarbamoyltransferase complex dimerization subunit type 1 TsaB [Oscillospiraceae bacterium]|nr:tRNA (adenosine(37)-N6)-threonylcarbamoyltransferase complex dimerization subunit type 1 TsaB [Oscillospiraceae bacterium]
MKVFCVDSASAAGSAALWCDGEVLFESYKNEGLTHSQTLMLRCDEVFAQTGTRPADVDVFAVTCGPGSFTGLRIGIGTVKGLAFVGDKPCCAVSSFEALAEAAKDEADTILTVLDARQKRVYCAAFRVENGVPVQVMENGLLPISQLAEALDSAGVVRPLVVGDAADAVCAALGDAVIPSDAAHRDIHAAAAVRVAARKAQAGDTCCASALRPLYLQLSQAERNLAAK